MSTGPQRLTDGASGCVQRLQYLRHDHSCIGVVTEPARHVSVRPAQQRIWWCTNRPKLPFLPQRGEAQACSLAKPVQTLIAGFKPLSQESNRASSCQRLLSSSPRPPSNSFQPSSQIVILRSKKVSTLQSSICRNNNQKQQSKLLRYLRDKHNVRFQKSCCSKCLRSPFKCRGLAWGIDKGCSVKTVPVGCCKRPNTMFLLCILQRFCRRALAVNAEPPGACWYSGARLCDRFGVDCSGLLLRRQSSLKSPLFTAAFRSLLPFSKSDTQNFLCLNAESSHYFRLGP